MKSKDRVSLGGDLVCAGFNQERKNFIINLFEKYEGTGKSDNLEILKEFDIWFVRTYYGDDRMSTEIYSEIQEKIKLLIENNTPVHTNKNGGENDRRI